MIFAAHQPNLLPYPGFWLKMDRADVFGLMPNAQFSKGDYMNRVQIGWEREYDERGRMLDARGPTPLPNSPEWDRPGWRSTV